MKRFLMLPVLMMTLFALNPGQAEAQEPMIGEIRMFAGNFAPRGWAFCDGQLLPIQNHQALFSLIGTIYGGDGRTNFALPDLRGRAPVHAGRGPGLELIDQGVRGGLSRLEIPQPKELAGPPHVVPGTPYLAVRFIIALDGLYPARE